MKFENPYMSDFQKINELRIWILVHSYLYYECNVSIVSDSVYDANARQLKELMEKHKGCVFRFENAFKDYVPDTGFDLWHKLSKQEKEYIREKARQAVIVCRKGKKK